MSDQNVKIAAPSSHASQIAGAKNKPNGSRDVVSTGRPPTMSSLLLRR